MRPRIHNLVGLRCGSLVVLRRAWESTWECKCDCGKTTYTRGTFLVKGQVKSCGCQNRGSTTHGHTAKNSPTRTEYRIWREMLRRCHLSSCPSYAAYGARGIRVCDSWRKSFDIFLRDVGPRPSMLYTLDRRDNRAGYFPGNCRWATKAEQVENRDASMYFNVFGVRQSLSAWAKQLGISPQTILKRLVTGQTLEEAFSIGGRSHRRTYRQDLAS